MPVCPSCGVDKAQEDFYWRKDTQSFLKECKVCRIDKQTCRSLGITRQELLTLEVRAGGKCECCKRKLKSSRYTRLAVDHNHDTGKVRGLLCQPCNTAIGLMDDDPVRLRQAVEYLESHNPTSGHQPK